MADIARRVLGIVEKAQTNNAAPDWPSLLLATGLVLAFLAVGFGLPGDLPLQAASWLTFVALVIMPGYLLGDMVTWRLDLDLLERLALALPLGVCVMAVPGMAAMLAHLTIQDLAMTWTLTVVGLIIAWLFHILFLRQDSSRSYCPPWRWDEIAMLLLLVAAFITMYPTLSVYKMDGDAYSVATFTADALTGRPLNATEPVLGTGRSLGSIRMGFNQMLPVFHLWSYLAQADHIELIGTASRSMLALWAILAAYMLGKAAGNGSRRLGFLTAAIQTLVYMAAPFFRADHVGIFFFERINADKFTVTVTMMPVVLGLAIRFVATGRRDTWLAAALSAFAVSSIHALIAAMLALALGAFGGLHLLLHLRSREARIRVTGLAGLTVIAMILPLVQLAEARNGEALAPTYPSSLEGWSIEERLVPVLPAVFPFHLMPALDVYGPLPDLAHLDVQEANSPTNPFLIWRFALNMRRQRIIVFDLDRYISDPTLILEPPYLLALLLLPLLLWRLRSDLGAEFALSTSLAVLFVLFNPIVTPILGSLVMPWILWRFVWLMPYALIVALAADRLLSALACTLIRLPWLRSKKTTLLATATLVFVVLAALALRPRIEANIQEMHARGAAPLVYATPEKILSRLQEETANSGPAMVMADQNLSVTIPAFVGNADIVAHRILSTAELFPADEQDLALQRHIDQYNFLNASHLTPNHLDILQRYGIRYVVIAGGTSLEAQLRLSPQWFEWLVSDEGYSLYAVRQVPTVTESIRGNAAFLQRQWERAAAHYQAAREQDPSDVLALLGMADVHRVGGEFEQAIATLHQALAQVEAKSPPPADSGRRGEFASALHHRLGQIYADMGQVERSIHEFDLAQRAEYPITQYHIALADACLSAGQNECAQLQFRAAVDTLGLTDRVAGAAAPAAGAAAEGVLGTWVAFATEAVDAARATFAAKALAAAEAQQLITLAGIWQQRAYDGLAVPLYERAAAVQPDEQTLLLLADSYRRAGQFNQAEEVLQKLRRLRLPFFGGQALSSSAAVESAMARLRADQGDIDRAVTLYRRVIRLQDLLAQDTRITRLNLAQILLEADLLDQARSEIEGVLSLQPHNATAYVLLGNLYRAQYEPTMAMKAYQHALQLDPTEAAAYTALSDQHRQQAMAPDETLALMQRAVEFNPEQAILVLTLADQFRRLGKVDLALTTYQQALGWFEPSSGSFSIGPQPARRTRALTYSRLAALYEDLGHVATAMNYYRAAVTVAPGQPWTWVTWGDALRRRNEATAAEEAYRAAIPIDPAQVDPHLRLASLLSDRGDPAAAIELYDQALQAALTGSNSAQTSRAWLAVGSFYSQSPSPHLLLGSDEEPVAVPGAGDADALTQRALAAYYQSLEAEESVAGVRALARLQQDLGQTAEAIRLYQQRIQLGEKERWVSSMLAQYYVGLGDVYLDADQGDQAIAAFRHAVDLDGWWPGARLALARGYADLGDPHRALAEIRQAVEIAPGSVEAQLALAGTLDEQGNGEQALAVYREVAQAHPGSVPASLALARAWEDRYYWDRAEESYRQALAMVPGDPEAYLGLAALVTRQARYKEAEELLRQALQIDRGDVAAYLQLGDLFARQARHNAALETYQQAAQLSPNDAFEALIAAYAGQAGIHRALGEIELAEGYLQEAISVGEAAARNPAADTPVRPVAAYLQLADLYQAQNQPDQVEQTLLLALERLSEDAAIGTEDAGSAGATAAAQDAAPAVAAQARLGIRQRLAGFYQSMGHGEEALRQLRLSVEENPESMPALVSYASQMRLQGLADAAEAIYQRAEEAGAPTAAGYRALAAARQAQGRGEEALAHLDRAIALAPEDAGSWIQKGRLQVQLELQGQIELGESEAAAGSSLLLNGSRSANPTSDWAALLGQATDLRPAEGRTWYALGDSLLAAGRTREAVPALEQAIAVEPMYLPAYGTLVEVYQELGQREDVARVVALAKAVVPGSHLGHLYEARAMEGMEQWDEARAALHQALAKAPAMTETYIALGQLEQQRGNVDEAANRYRQAIDLRPGEAAAYLNLTDLLLTRAENLEALALTQRAVERRPGDGDLMLRLGRIQRLLGRYAEAESSLLQGAHLEPNADSVQAELGLVYLAQAQPGKAIAAYEQAITLRPDQSGHHLALSRIWSSQGRPEHALSLLRQARPLVLDPIALYVAMSDLYLRRGEPVLALETLEEGIQECGEESRLLQALANYHRSRADFDRADEIYSQATTLYPDEAASHLAAGGEHLSRGRAAEALVEYERAVALDAGNATGQGGRAYQAVGNAHRLLGDAEQATAAYEQALALDPRSEDAYIGLASVYRGQARWQEARAVYFRGLAAVPTSGRLLIDFSDLLLQRGDEEGALSLLDRAVELAPSARTYVARTALYRVLGRAADAQQDLETARQVEPASVEALAALGSLQQSQGNASDAEGAYRRALSLEPGTAASYVALANLAYVQGQIDDAWWQFEAARTVEPASVDPIVGLAAARSGQGDWEEAEEAYRQALELAPATTAAHLGLADLAQRRSGNLEDAVEGLLQAQVPGLNQGAIYRTIGDMYRNAAQSVRAADYLQQAVELELASPQAYLALADLCLAEGRPQDAERYALLALEIAPRDPAVHLALGNVDQSLGAAAAAQSHYQEAIDLDATRIDGYAAWAELYVVQEKYAEAVAAYEEAIDKAPLDWSLWVSLGNVYVAMEKYDDALSAYERATEMNASVPEPWLRQGDVYVTKKKWKSARAAYEQAQMLRPNEADPLLRLASVYEERDDAKQARSYARQAIEVDPASAAGHVMLGRIWQEEGKNGKAADAVLSAIQLDPRRLAAYDLWMWCYTDIKREPYSVDRSRLETELAKFAKRDESRTVWGQVLLARGTVTLEEENTEKAIPYLEEAVRLDPAFVQLYRELAEAYEKTLDGRRALESWYRYLYATTGSEDRSEAQEQIDALLQVHIEKPGDGERVSGSVKVKGTAANKAFKAYKLRYRAAGSSGSWSTIAKAQSEVENGLLGTWDTSELVPGAYRLRLSVEKNDGKDLPRDEITVEIAP